MKILPMSQHLGVSIWKLLPTDFQVVFAIYLGFYTLRDPLEIDVWIFEILDNNLGIKNDFTKYLKESCC